MSDDDWAAGGRLMQQLYGKEVSGAIVAAAQLKLADAIEDTDAGSDVAQIAARAEADPEATLSLLRALAIMGIVRRTGDRRYGHTAISRGLRTGAPQGFLDMVLMAGAQWTWAMSSRTGQAVRTGKPVFPEVYGKDLFSYFAEDDPESGAAFDKAMTAMNEASLPGVVAALEPNGAGSVADVGGGQGSLLRALLLAHPGLTGTLVDVEQAIGEAHPELTGELAGRARLVVGDCTAAVPVSADLYLLRHVLHMWDDRTAATVLRNCAASAVPGARVVVVEQLLDEDADDPSVALLNLHMLAIGGGRTRTAGDFARLFEQAGLDFAGVSGSPESDQLIEGTVP